MANEICFRSLHLDNPWTLATYQSVGGYEQWLKILKEKTPPQQIIEAVKTATLRGRGQSLVRPSATSVRPARFAA